MTSGRVEVITSVERRRRWSSAEKEQLVAATLEPGASVSSVARANGLHPGQLYGWRRQLRTQPQIGFAPVRIASGAAPAGLADVGTIEIEFASGARMRITGRIRRRSRRSSGRWPGTPEDDDPCPERRAGVVGEWPHRYAQRLRRAGAAGAGDAEAQPARRQPVRVPRPARFVNQGPVARRPGHVPVRQTAGARSLHLAVDGAARERRADGDDHAGAAGRSHSSRFPFPRGKPRP